MSSHPLSIDTPPEIEGRLIDGWRAMSPAQKARTVAGLTAAAFEMTMAGIRHRHPEEPEEMHRRRLAEILYGERVARLLFADRDR